MSEYMYLASPYTGTPEVMLARFHEAKKALHALCHQRVWVYSPIVHCHQLALDHEMPTDFQFWLDYNHVMIEASCGIVVLGIDGWDRSKGVAEEMAFAKQIEKPIYFCDPNNNYEITTMIGRE